MCLAVREWEEEAKRIGREEGRREGLDEGRIAIVKNLILRGYPDEEIMQVAECSGEYVARVKLNL